MMQNLSKIIIVFSFVLVSLAVLSQTTPVNAANGCDRWRVGWKEPGTGKTIEQVTNAPAGFSYTPSALKFVEEMCVESQDTLGLSFTDWASSVQSFISGCLIDNNQEVDYCRNETYRFIPSIPGVAENKANTFKKLCEAKLGAGSAQCAALTDEVRVCIEGGTAWETCFDRFGRDLGIYYDPSRCPAGNWSCNGKCATESVMEDYNRRWCDGKARWLWAQAGNTAACGGSASKPAGAGCSTTCAVGEWSCGAECANNSVQATFNSTWVDGQSQWKFESQSKQGISCGGAQSTRKCVAPTNTRCDCGTAGPNDDVCVANASECSAKCSGATSSAGPISGPTSDPAAQCKAKLLKPGINIAAGCKATNEVLCNCVVDKLNAPGTVDTVESNRCISCLCNGNSWSGIGCINTNSTNGIITSVMRIVLGIMGGIALILMIISGYLYNTGQTDNVAKAKQTVTAMFAAIIFIVFSVLLLRFIGVNVLDVTTVGIIG